jgi:hypothetical protein
MEKQINEITELLYNYTKKEHIMASKVILEEYARVLVENGYGKIKYNNDRKCKLGLDKVKMSNCQECPHFEDCYVEQLEEISDGQAD